MKMMKVYICPECGWLRMVSRRKEVECHKCEGAQMELTNLEMTRFADMTEQQREDYSAAWLYIHNRKKGSNYGNKTK